MVDLGKALRTARKGRGRSRKDVAHAAGVSPRALANVELGKGSLKVFEAAAAEVDFRLAGIGAGGNVKDQMRLARERKKLTASALAARAGVAVATVHNLERGLGHISSLERVLPVLAPSRRVRRPERANWDKGGRDDRLTPDWLLAAIVAAFGPISLDPCASRTGTIPAERHFYREDDGLSQPWDAKTVFANVPFSQAAKWAAKAYGEWSAGRAETVIALLPSRTNTKAFFDYVAGQADIIFLSGRPCFNVPKRGYELGGVAFGILVAVWGGEADRVRKLARQMQCILVPATSVERSGPQYQGGYDVPGFR